LLNAALVRAIGDVKLGCDFLVSQLNQSISADWLVQNRLQLLPGINAVAEL
jgi:hypothetical protein